MIGFIRTFIAFLGTFENAIAAGCIVRACGTRGKALPAHLNLAIDATTGWRCIFTLVACFVAFDLAIAAFCADAGFIWFAADETAFAAALLGATIAGNIVAVITFFISGQKTIAAGACETGFSLFRANITGLNTALIGATITRDAFPIIACFSDIGIYNAIAARVLTNRESFAVLSAAIACFDLAVGCASVI